MGSALARSLKSAIGILFIGYRRPRRQKSKGGRKLQIPSSKFQRSSKLQIATLPLAGPPTACVGGATRYCSLGRDWRECVRAVESKSRSESGRSAEWD